MEKIPNKGKNLIIGVDGQKYARIPVKTELVNFGDDLISVIKKYITSEFHEKDYLVISEKIVSVCQNNFRHISTVKVGSLAKLIVKGVKKYPNDIGFSRAEKMQIAIDISGRPRMLLAMVLGVLGKIFGIRGNCQEAFRDGT